uniref:Uncharacterized protein n=1 Tax=Octopus bimaculoides TaxID=37653 RepID=A0A0L8H5E9_OCTBM
MTFTLNSLANFISNLIQINFIFHSFPEICQWHSSYGDITYEHQHAVPLYSWHYLSWFLR